MDNDSFLGGCCGSRSKKTRVGGWAWAWWLVTDVQRLSLEVSVKKSRFVQLVTIYKLTEYFDGL